VKALHDPDLLFGPGITLAPEVQVAQNLARFHGVKE
jgi:hypothetical protein